MQDNKKTFWPYGILLSIFAIICACIATIIFSLDYPVYEDEFYFDTYQNVKYSYEDIEKKQVNFNKNYKLSYTNPNQTFKDRRGREVFVPNSSMNFKILCIKSTPCLSAKNANIAILLTRPHTSDEDLSLKPIFIDDNSFYVDIGELNDGRWQLKLKIEFENENTGFFTYNLNTQKIDA